MPCSLLGAVVIIHHLSVHSIRVEHNCHEYLQVAQMVKNQPAGWETRIQSLGQEDPLENGYSLQCSCLENPMDRGGRWGNSP